jgi:VanZ family protein
MFVPLRSATINDLVTDTAGIFTSTVTYLYYKKNR